MSAEIVVEMSVIYFGSFKMNAYACAIYLILTMVYLHNEFDFIRI